MQQALRTIGVALTGNLYVSLFWLKAPAGWPCGSAPAAVFSSTAPTTSPVYP